MANPPTNTQQIVDAKSLREDLAQTISNLSPMDTPILSRIRRTKAASYQPEWLTDTYPSPERTARPFGHDVDYKTGQTEVRNKNICETHSAAVVVSEEEERAVHAGFSSRVNYEMIKQGIALRLGWEELLFGTNQGAVVPASGNTHTGKTGSIHGFIETNVVEGAGATTGGVDATTRLPVARAAGTAADFEENTLRDITDEIWENTRFGAQKQKLAFMNIKQKRKFSAFAGIAGIRVPQGVSGQATAVGAVDVYWTDTGPVMTVLDRWMNDDEILFLNPMYLEIRALFWMYRKMPAEEGYNRKRAIACSAALCVKNERAHALVADRTTT